MGDTRRPYQEESLIQPCHRHYYSACWLGRGQGDMREQPTKLTQTLNQTIFYEATQEWNARLCENTVAADKYINGELEEEAKALEKTMSLMDDLGATDMIAKAEAGGTEGAVGMLDEAAGMASSDTMVNALDELLTIDMFTSYGIHPPIIALPIRLSPAVITLLLGNSLDNFYNAMDTYTLENQPFIESWHYEDGVQKARASFWYDNAEQILERRHMRTGEKYRYICVQRPVGEGSAMTIDLLKDVRNEKTPEFAESTIYGFPYTTGITPDCQSASRSLYEFISTVIYSVMAPTFGWPFQAYGSPAWLPRPGIISMLLDLIGTVSIDVIVPRFVGILAGANGWFPRYNISHLETTMEVIGSEMIPPTPMESSSSYIKYGMDRCRLPSSFIQSKRLYGQEGHIIAPTEYPVPEKQNATIDGAIKDIEDARKNHPEWLTDIKGFAQ